MFGPVLKKETETRLVYSTGRGLVYDVGGADCNIDGHRHAHGAKADESHFPWLFPNYEASHTYLHPNLQKVVT